jgi:hypothetical protein
MARTFQHLHLRRREGSLGSKPAGGTPPAAAEGVTDSASVSIGQSPAKQHMGPSALP